MSVIRFDFFLLFQNKSKVRTGGLLARKLLGKCQIIDVYKFVHEKGNAVCNTFFQTQLFLSFNKFSLVQFLINFYIKDIHT